MPRSSQLVLVLVLMMLAGCGYRPLYGARDQGANVESELGAIRVENESSRLGQLVRNELISQMGSGGGSTYELKLDVGDSTSTVITYPEPRASRKAVELTVGYRLFGSDRRKALTQGTVKSKVDRKSVV